jgi:hypothetical protein
MIPILVLAACGGGSSVEESDETRPTLAPTTVATTEPESTTTAPEETTTTEAPKATSVTISPLFTRGTEGGVGKEVISVAESSDGSLRVDFSEDEVEGLGDQSRAASWSAVTVATLLTGSPLSGQYRFEITGPIDGPSAGALKTVALLSLLRGETLADDITMTGTVNPDGTVGPVGGIPEKVQGAASEGFRKVLVPLGQRNSTSIATGELVDVVDLGTRLGIEVEEVGDVYAAYEEFTGEELPKLPSSTDTQLTKNTYDRLAAKSQSFLADYQAAVSNFGTLNEITQAFFGFLLEEAGYAADRSANLQRQGLSAGAFTQAAVAAVLAEASESSARAFEVLIFQSPEAFFNQVAGTQAVEGKLNSLFGTLKTFTPKTVSDASALMNAYATAFDAFAYTLFASNQLRAIGDAFFAGQISAEDAQTESFVPVIYNKLAEGLIDYASAQFEVARDLGGPEIESDIDVATVADFFRKGADANFSAFQTTVVKSNANRLGVSEDRMLNRFANIDDDIALSQFQRNVVEGIKQYIGPNDPNAEYAELGYAISNYARNALLVEKYYSNGILDEDLNIVGVRYENALSTGLELAKAQVSSAIGLLRDSEIEPALEVAGLEVANIDREGDVADKFNALSSYWGSQLSARVLAYLAGLERDGLE